MSLSSSPWRSIWFEPHKTAADVRDHRPLYGVWLLVALHVLTTVVGFTIESSQLEPPPSIPDASEKAGLYLDIWIMPVVFLFVLYWIGRRLNGQAELFNVFWVVLWSQLPVIVLTLISIAMHFAGMKITEPLFANKLTTVDGSLFIDPPVLQLNVDGMIYFVLSTILFLWSFQILLSGVAAVNRVSVKRALWFLTLAMIALMIIRLPFTIALGDRDLLDILGLKGILQS